MSKDASGQVDPKKTNGEKRVKRGRLHFTEEEVTRQDKEQASGQVGPRRPHEKRKTPGRHEATRTHEMT